MYPRWETATGKKKNFWWFLTWNQPLPFFTSKSCVDHSGTEMSATISRNHFKMPRFPCVSVCVCVVFYDQIRIDQKWHCADLLVLNILAESSFSCSEALGGQGLMLPFETCRKHTNTHMSTKQKDRGRGEKEITMRFSASQSSPPTKLSESLGHADLSSLHQLASDWAIQIDWAWQEGTSRAELGQHDKDNAWSQMAALIIICLTPPQQNPFKAERH